MFNTLSRREFFLGAGALTAVSALPSFAEDDPSVFPGRGRFEQLVISSYHVDAGATAPFSILHISDTHLTAAYPDELEGTRAAVYRRIRTFGGYQETALKTSLAWAKAHCDFVLHTGDLIDFQSRANFDLVRKYWGEGIFGSMGNHEFYTYLPNEKIGSDEEFKKRSWPILKDVYPVDASFSSRIVNGVNFVAMNDVFGTVTAEQVEKFELEIKKKLPIVLCMHVPFLTERIWRATCRYWKYNGKRFDASQLSPPITGDYLRQHNDAVTSKFIARLRQEPLLKAILVGHEHITVEDRFSPTAMECVVGGNFMFAAREVTFS